jgi:hypothetical protein
VLFRSDLVSRCNKEFYGLLYQLDVVKCMKFKRLKWADNRDSIENCRQPKNVLNGRFRAR